MLVRVQFYSYLKEVTGCTSCPLNLHEGANVSELLDALTLQFPKLQPFRKSILVAVGVEYQPLAYQLHDGDEVSIFPPVQGG
jgi:MoaD family protein